VKSLLSRRAIRYRRTHDLAELLDTLKDEKINYPAEMEPTIALTPDEPPFDRAGALRLAELAVAWAAKVAGEAPPAP
jgi:HEPN domain-containing protein